MDHVAGKTVVITGASRGIGAASARVLAQMGAHVVLGARDKAALDALAKEIGGTALACDVADYDQTEALIAAAGRVDVLVNNAGLIEPIARLEDSDPKAWSTVVDVNLKGVYNGIRAVLPRMAEQGSGTIINISSGAAYNVLEGWSHYCATKAAVLQLTRAVHKEMADRGIRSIGLSPGTVATDMQRDIKASGINPVAQLDWDAHIPPEWVGQAIAGLMGPVGDAYLGQDFTLKTNAERAAVGLPPVSA
jgi:NADP-dependent 3-hydroxy acid dehydrogenase YdfG